LVDQILEIRKKLRGHTEAVEGTASKLEKRAESSPAKSAVPAVPLKRP
jgi:hypothetical protein